MDPIDRSLVEALFLDIFDGQEVGGGLRDILGHSVKCGGLGIPNPITSSVRRHSMSDASCNNLL